MNRLAPRVEAATGARCSDRRRSLSRVSVSATAGLRYTHERKTIDNAGRPLRVRRAGGPARRARAYAYQDAIEHDAWTPRVALQLRVAEQSLAYVSATRGFKSGGFNISSPRAGPRLRARVGVELRGGLKSTFADGRARLNLAAFHTDYTDLQVQTAIRPGILDISNAAAATIRRRRAGGRLAAGTRARARRTPGLAGRSLRPVPGGGSGRGHGRRGRPSAEQRARVVGTPVARVDRPGRTRGDVVASRGVALAEHRLLHAVQRRGPAAEPLWPAGHERRGRARRWCGRRLRPERDGRGLHHGHLRLAAAGDRGPSGGAPA